MLIFLTRTMVVRFGLFINVRNTKLQFSFARFFCLVKTKPAMMYDRTLFGCNQTLFPHHAFIKALYIYKRRNYLIQHGNLLAHEVMENNNSYVNTVVLHPMKTIQSGNFNHEVSAYGMFEIFYLMTFHNLKEQRTIGDAEFTSMVLSLTRQISNASFNDLRLVFFCLCLWSRCTNSYVPNFKPLWNKLDVECTKRLKTWNITQKLLIGDYWFHLRLSKMSIYNKNMIKDLIDNCNKLTNSQFVQLMFYINLQRTIPQHFLDTLEKKLELIIHIVSLKELSIISLGFFNTDNKVSNNLWKLILERTTSNIDDLDSASVIRLLKILRRGFHPSMTQHFFALLKGCVVNMERWNLLTAVHTSMLCEESNIFQPFLLDLIVEKLKINIADARLKDMDKVIQCLSTFNYMPYSEFPDILFEEVMKVDRLEDAKKFPRNLVNLLLFCAYMNQYPLNVYEYVLSSNFVQLCQATYGDGILITLAIIDYCIEIERNEYIGPRLKPNLLSVLKKYRSTSFTESSSKSNNVVDNLLKHVMETLSHLITPDNYALRHVLPHMFNPDIIVRLSSNNSIPLQQITDACLPEVILRPYPGELWGCLIMCGPFAFPFKSNRPCGLIAMKERQLKKLGYRTVLIPFQDFPRHDKHRESYLKKKLDYLTSNY